MGENGNKNIIYDEDFENYLKSIENPSSSDYPVHDNEDEDEEIFDDGEDITIFDWLIVLVKIIIAPIAIAILIDKIKDFKNK